MERCPPVEAVRSQVDESAPAREELVEGIEHRRRPVLGVRAGDDDPVATEDLDASLVKQVVGDHVVIRAGVVEPGGHIGVGGEGPHTAFRSQVEDRSQVRAEHDTAAVAVVVVGAGPDLGMVEQEALVVHRSPRTVAEDAVGHRGELDVRVRAVGDGRGEEGDRRGSAIRRRCHEERDVILARRGGHAERVDAARKRVGHVEGDARLPARVVEVVAVEVDRAVLLRRLAPVVHLAGPGDPRHGSGGELDRPSVQS